jgi:hypothetical protein
MKVFPWRDEFEVVVMHAFSNLQWSDDSTLELKAFFVHKVTKIAECHSNFHLKLFARSLMHSKWEGEPGDYKLSSANSPWNQTFPQQSWLSLKALSRSFMLSLFTYFYSERHKLLPCLAVTNTSPGEFNIFLDRRELLKKFSREVPLKVYWIFHLWIKSFFKPRWNLHQH